MTVGVTADPRYSRMTVVSLGDQTVLEQIKNQLNKLEDVRDIKELQPDRSVFRELMMIKVRAGEMCIRDRRCSTRPWCSATRESAM